MITLFETFFGKFFRQCHTKVRKMVEEGIFQLNIKELVNKILSMALSSLSLEVFKLRVDNLLFRMLE